MLENLPELIISLLLAGGIGYFGYKKYLNNKLNILKSNEEEVDEAIKKLEEGLQRIKDKHKGKSSEEIEDYWNNDNNNN